MNQKINKKNLQYCGNIGYHKLIGQELEHHNDFCSPITYPKCPIDNRYLVKVPQIMLSTLRNYNIIRILIFRCNLKIKRFREINIMYSVTNIYVCIQRSLFIH